MEATLQGLLWGLHGEGSHFNTSKIFKRFLRVERWCAKSTHVMDVAMA